MRCKTSPKTHQDHHIGTSKMVTLNPQGSKPHFGSKYHMQQESNLEMEGSSLNGVELVLTKLEMLKQWKKMVERGWFWVQPRGREESREK